MFTDVDFEAITSDNSKVKISFKSKPLQTKNVTQPYLLKSNFISTPKPQVDVTGQRTAASGMSSAAKNRFS